MKYVDSMVTFSEVPNEISLCVNISGCQIHCPGCHSQYLWDNIGTELTPDLLKNLISRNPGISCICLMGGKEKDVVDLLERTLALGDLKIAWYTGSSKTPGKDLLSKVDYVKLGPYISRLGPITSKTTNQRFYFVKDSEMIDRTELFWKTSDEI